jgi:HJR/Mrr/RecB family endonuclease
MQGYPSGVVSLISRALSALLLGLALLVGGAWHLAETYPFEFWLSAIPATGLFIALWRYDRQLQRQELDARLRDEHVPSMSPTEYERFVKRQLELAGWFARHVGRTGDQGCDVLAELHGFKAVVQVKKCRAGNSAVQEVVAARHHYGAQIMVVVALDFTAAARQLAASNGVHLLLHSELATLERVARIP